MHSATTGSGSWLSGAPPAWARPTAELVQDAGAEVVVMDFAEVKLPGAKAIHVNLAEEASIDAAVDECGGPIHALFSCAGVADGTPGIEKINFVGHRHLINRMLAGDMLPRGSAIGFISSAAGLGWEASLGEIKEYLDTPDFDSGSAWAVEHGYADYFHSKQAVCAYVAREAFPLLKQGIRINAICPGPTDTPLAQANAEMWLGFGADFREETGIEASTPLEQAYPLVFLCSDAAAAISGITLISDVGYVSSGHHQRVPAGQRGRRVPARPQLGLTGLRTASAVRRVVRCGRLLRAPVDAEQAGRTEATGTERDAEAGPPPQVLQRARRARRCSTGRARGSRWPRPWP